MYNYSKTDICEAISNIGIGSGDILFCHSNIGFFGKLENALSSADYYKIFKKAIFDVIGDSGTFVAPAFSYTFCNEEDFFLETTPGVCGMLSECVRKDSKSVRSLDPNFSVSAIGKMAKELTENVANHSFGKNSFFDRFYQNNGKILNFNFDVGSTFIHYVEKCLDVPYRYDKGFAGTLHYGDKLITETFYHYVFDHNIPEHAPDFNKFHNFARDKGYVKTKALGKGEIVLISAKDTYECISNNISHMPDMLIKGVDNGI